MRSFQYPEITSSDNPFSYSYSWVFSAFTILRAVEGFKDSFIRIPPGFIASIGLKSSLTQILRQNAQRKSLGA